MLLRGMRYFANRGTNIGCLSGIRQTRYLSSKKIFVCTECDAQHHKWVGRCNECGVWNAVVEEDVISQPSASSSSFASSRKIFDVTSFSKPTPMNLIEAPKNQQRIILKNGEFNRVLGGGLVPGSVILIGGAPGVGKSTLMMQVADWLSISNFSTNKKSSNRVCYFSGEESESQLKLRGDRLKIKSSNLHVLSENRLEAILNHLNDKDPFDAVIIDSIQAIRSEESRTHTGSVTQIKLCAAGLTQLAKARNIPLFLVGHITKNGEIAGPNVLEHMVDTVLFLDGENDSNSRILRCFKNRFGDTSEVAAFEMRNTGLVEVDPANAFLSRLKINDPEINQIPGAAVAISYQGSRAVPVEIQALVSKSFPNMPTRYKTSGLSNDRFHVIVAVLSQRLNLPLSGKDIYLSVVGGAKIREHAADLAIAIAIASSLKNVAVPLGTCFIGEVGLGGELHDIDQLENRIKASYAMGFNRVIAKISDWYAKQLDKSSMPNLTLVPVKTLNQAIKETFKEI